MKLRKLFYVLPILYIASFFLGTTSVFATEDMNPYTYEVIKPENQVDEVGYFNLRMQPDQEQVVQIKLKNQTDQEVTVAIGLNGAKTNSNGVIEFGPSTIENDASLKYDFKDIVSGPETVVIPASGETIVDITIKMPAATIDGLIVGGLHMKKVPTAEEEEARKEQSGVINEYAYLVGMVLSEAEMIPQADLELNKVYAGLANYRNAVFINFSNVQPNFLDDMGVEAQIMQAGSSEVLYDTKKLNMRMAPNSMIDFPVLMDGDRMEPGDYTAHILVTSGDRKWEWDHDFTITKEEADKYNAQDVSLVQERGIDWKLIAMIVGGVFVAFLVIFFIVRAVRKKGNKGKNKKKSKSKKGKKSKG